MQWENPHLGRLPVKSWCAEVERDALGQAANLANHPKVFSHVALMPDCHVGYGMPIGGVVACRDAVIPNAVGVDIGCGMCAVRTGLPAESIDQGRLRRCLEAIEQRIPLGEGHAHATAQRWERLAELPAWLDAHARELAARNLGTLGGGNHFIELQAGDDGFLWAMLHSGSRNLGYRIAEHHHRIAVGQQPGAGDLAWLEAGSRDGASYIREMRLALDYAAENRRRMMAVVKEVILAEFKAAAFPEEINIHHNYAGLEEHFGASVWVHRKGATSARSGEPGIIPGSMGTRSYIVRGKGAVDSFASCSHGAGRTMGRMAASRSLSREACDRAMRGVVFSGWKPMRGRGARGARLLDLSEAPLAYKDIDAVIAAQLDLVEPVVRLRPLGVLKG